MKPTPARTGTDAIREADLRVGSAKAVSVGLPSVVTALRVAIDQMGVGRTLTTLSHVNQPDGFDCPGCAWPDPEHRKGAEFCENGAKAVAEEATRRTVGPDFFAAHDVAWCRGQDDYWLGQQGRLTHPMLLDADATHYRPIEWDAALDLIANQLRALPDPDQAVFYTSGRTSNEAAFCYQLMVRGFGTNNLPDCADLCHESSGAALSNTIGIGKGTITLRDLESASLIIVAGQNPGTNHPRMLSSLETAKANGAVIVAVNPLPEAGLIRFKNPQKVRGVVGAGTRLADEYLQIRLGGDLALFSGLGKVLLAAQAAGRHTNGLGGVFDTAFIEATTTGFESWLAHLRSLEWSEIEAGSGLRRAQIEALGERLLASTRTVVCWAMGLTQHKHSVAMIQEIVNVLLAQGNIGRPGAGLCPVRGHSNVQGDRTMGISERMPSWFLDAVEQQFEFRVPREVGMDTVAAVRAMRDGRIRVFMSVGGNFVRAMSDSDVTEAAVQNTDLTVQVSTKLNRSHFVTGKRALILPVLGRTDADVQASGPQQVTVEDSMSMVHASRGRLEPPGPQVRSEVWLVCELARRLLDGRPGPAVDWAALPRDYRKVRALIERTIPGFADFEERIARPGGFALPHPPRDERAFKTASGKAKFTVNQLWYPTAPPGRLLLQTVRSHDQFNTTIYGKDDRYRGIRGGRRVVFVNPEDVSTLGLADGDYVDLISEYDGVERRADRFRIVAYDTTRGCAAAYFPETNVLVPLDSQADVSGTPTSKSIVVRLERSAVQEPAGVA